MEKPALTHQHAHVLFELSILESKEADIDDKTQKSYQNLKQLISGKTAKECHEIYMKHVATNPQLNTEELTMGLLVAILVEQDGLQNKYYRDVVTLSKDSLNLFSNCLNRIIIERLSKLREHSVKQILWIANQLMKANINSAEYVCSNLIRQIAGGDLSTKNLWLIENLLELFNENRSWLINSTTFMVPTIIYTFMRLISDHMGPGQNTLRQKEIDFVIGLIREKFIECMHVGRDFLRLLHNIIKIPEFEKLWQDILNSPKSLHPNFQNPLQLLTNRTPRRLFQSRLTFEMERKISFLATQVKFGNQKRYQDWFHKQYLATPESLSLRSDLIRYICAIIHPSNEVLCSDIIPRWAIIGWLLTTCTTNASANNSKLALFFDWLLYDAKMDNIMNIEPAILVMYYSMRSHPNVTASLLDFLCRIPSTFFPKFSEHTKAGIKKSLHQILEKRVVPSLAPLFENPKHDPALKAVIRETFPEFCAGGAPLDNGVTSTGSNLNQNLAPNYTSATNVKQADVIIIDQDKIVSPSDSPIPPLLEVFGNKTSPNNDVNNTNKTIVYCPIQNEDKYDQGGSSSSCSSRDEAKAFSWNGIDNSNASYSHKQNHDNKIRKSSLTNPGSIDPIKRAKETCVDVVANDSINNDSNTTSVMPSSNPSEPLLVDLAKEDTPSVKVIYPFFSVPDLDFKESSNLFEDPIRKMLENLSSER